MNDTDKQVIHLDDDCTAIIDHGGSIVKLKQDEDLVVLTADEVIRLAEQLKIFRKAARVGGLFR